MQGDGEHDEDATFDRARAYLGRANQARAELAECWTRLCDEAAFDSQVVRTGDTTGRLDVAVSWPSDVAERADAAAASFANEICAALDGALLAAAASVSGALERPAPDDYRFPSCEEERSFKELLETGHFRGLRPDQVEAVRSIASHVVV